MPTHILTMSVQSIHTSKLLATSITTKRPEIGMQLLMPLAVMLPREPFATARPVTHERLFLLVRSDVA